jgi:hypothetical protein
MSAHRDQKQQHCSRGQNVPGPVDNGVVAHSPFLLKDGEKVASVAHHRVQRPKTALWRQPGAQGNDSNNGSDDTTHDAENISALHVVCDHVLHFSVSAALTTGMNHGQAMHAL